jgi:hypothetical protein
MQPPLRHFGFRKSLLEMSMSLKHLKGLKINISLLLVAASNMLKEKHLSLLEIGRLILQQTY